MIFDPAGVPANGGFTLKGHSNPTLKVSLGSTNEVQIRVNATGGLIRTTGAYPLIMGANQNENVTITSGGHLLLNTTTDYADANSDDLQIYGTGDTGMGITSGSSSYGSIYFGDSTSGSARNAGILRYGHSGDSMEFWTAEGRRLVLDSNGRLLLGQNSADTDIGLSLIHI